MNYTYLPCREHFTAGQGARMRWVINQGGINPPDPAFPPSLDGILVTGIFEDLAITNQEIWDLSDFPSGFVTINQSLSVEPGASLSITSAIIVQFAANASLHVKPNGLLELDGNLTGLCGSPWQGVFVWGDCSKGQQPVNNIYAQGRFNGKSNGVIENAQSAIRNFGPNTGESGGQIKCTGTTFRNNRLGVVFREYINRTMVVTSNCTPAGLYMDDVSMLDRCKFETNDNYSLDLDPFEAFIDLKKVRGVKILGCDFSNIKTNVVCSGGISDNCYGYGIKSFSAGFRMHNSLSGVGISKFKGLSYGIHALISALSKPITINGAEFTDCYNGIYASQATGIDISSCKFFMGKVPNPAVRDRKFGTILFQTSTYKYRGNKAYGPPVNVEKTVGTCVNDCGDLNNVVFHNRYDDVMIGNVANLSNAGGPLTVPRGLLYECNTNTDVYGFEFISNECALPECCQFGERGSERDHTQQSTDIGLHVYPNPASNEVTFDLVSPTASAHLKIFDLSGNLLWTNEFQGRTVWQTTTLPTGPYFYTLAREGEKPQSGKVSIIH